MTTPKNESRHFLTLALAATLAGSFGCGAEPSESAPLGEESAALGPTPIARWEDLTAMGETGNYVLTASINASGRTWIPKVFRGTLDGGGRTISNLTVNTDAGGLFSYLENATVTNLKLTNLRVTSPSFGGGLAASMSDSVVDKCAVEVTVTGGGIAGGLFGFMYGGTVTRTYAKGSITGSQTYAGGLAGIVNWGAGRPNISQSYAQMTVTPSTSGGYDVYAGGIAGYAFGPNIVDVYAIGNVTGRGAVGGLVGYLDCVEDSAAAFLYKGIYRGDVTDRNWSANNGWAGTVGAFPNCIGSRITGLHWDSTLDMSRNSLNLGTGQKGSSTRDLRLPTEPNKGVFCQADVVPGRCGDNGFADPPWNPGNDQQHHVLRDMPGPNVQLR
jgi:hypothetical protein